VTCVNSGREPWANKANLLEPASCVGPDPEPPGPCPEPMPPGPFGPGCIGWEVGPNECPAPPINVEVVSPLFAGTLDLRWDNPAILAKNGKFTILGVNIYRSDTSERGPYHRLNAAPVGGTFYRDYTDNVLAEREVVDWETSWLSRGLEANDARWTFRTKFFPIVKKSGQAIAANSPMDVQLIINNTIVPVHAVFGPTGEVTLINARGYDFATERWIEPTLPTGPETAVSLTYYYNRNAVRTDLDKKTWYRITTVALDPNSPTGFRETPLEFTEPATYRAVEHLDYIWREAIRRNNWILEQGGERVKVFIKKTSGQVCWCRRDPKTLEYMQQPVSSCKICYGTGFVGGYEGPYDMIVAPDDNERAVRQTPNGRYLDHIQDVWTGPSPLLTMRDFIVKQSNERYSIGAVRKPSARGNIMQQHFQIKYLEENDIRYDIMLFDTTELCWPECRGRPAVMQGGGWMEEYPPTGPYPVGANYQQTPMQTEKENVPDEREQRGRTPVWENTTYGLLPFAVWWGDAISSLLGIV
jgi:hypothetical protein